MLFDKRGLTQAEGMAGRRPARSLLFRRWWLASPATTGGKEYLCSLHVSCIIREKCHQKCDVVLWRSAAGGFDVKPQSGRSHARFD
jgi:hypothetical protein